MPLTSTLPSREQPSESILLLHLLQELHTRPALTMSNLARDNADLFAEAASRGLITTEVVPGTRRYGRIWKITSAGLYFLNAGASLIASAELHDYEKRIGATSDTEPSLP